MLVATGAATVLARLRTRPQLGRTLILAAMFGILAFGFGSLVVDVSRIPRDATAEAALQIQRSVDPATPVIAHVPYPLDLSHFLDRPVTSAWTNAEARLVCRLDRRVVYVDQPYLVPRAVLPCLDRPGVRRYRYEQFARGGRIDVWIVPTAADWPPRTKTSGTYSLDTHQRVSRRLADTGAVRVLALDGRWRYRERSASAT
jgi:hypothetical protein